MPDQPTSGTSGASQPQQPGAPAINVEKLADRVYQLMLADARLSRSRSDVPFGPTRMGEG